MKNKYNIYPEYNFIAAKLSPGYQNFEHIYDFMKSVLEDPLFPEIYYMLVDMHGVKFNFELKKIHKLIRLVYKYKSKDNRKIGVYMLDEPMVTVYSKMFFSALKKNRDYCFTPEKAYSLLNLSVPFKKFMELIDI